MAPDLPHPSGGIKVIYNYVEHLVDLGYDACVWHGTPGFGYSSWEHHAPVETGLALEFIPGDVLVMPETGGSKWAFLNPDTPTVMLCQGMDFVFADAGFTEDVPGAYPGWRQATCVLSVSEAISTFLEGACEQGFPIYRIPVEIESWFAPSAKRRQIALMPRRRREDLIGAVQLLRRSGRLGDWEIVLIDGMTQPEVASALGEAAIFLFGAEREGFGLPGAEAMAAGCYVVGFTGDGAKEYLLPDCSSVVPDSDVVAMRDLTLEAMNWFDRDRATYDEKVAIGAARVRERYSGGQVRSALDTAFSQITAEDSASLIQEPMIIQHYMSHGPRGGWPGRVYRGARRMARRTIDRLSND